MIDVMHCLLILIVNQFICWLWREILVKLKHCDSSFREMNSTDRGKHWVFDPLFIDLISDEVQPLRIEIIACFINTELMWTGTKLFSDIRSGIEDEEWAELVDLRTMLYQVIYLKIRVKLSVDIWIASCSCIEIGASHKRLQFDFTGVSHKHIGCFIYTWIDDLVVIMGYKYHIHCNR